MDNSFTNKSPSSYSKKRPGALDESRDPLRRAALDRTRAADDETRHNLRLAETEILELKDSLRYVEI